jgi:hypothetical protein
MIAAGTSDDKDLLLTGTLLPQARIVYLKAAPRYRRDDREDGANLEPER